MSPEEIKWDYLIDLLGDANVEKIKKFLELGADASRGLPMIEAEFVYCLDCGHGWWD